MIRYIIKRILWMIPVIVAVSVVIFSLMHFVPSDPARMIVGVDATEEMYQAKRAELGLDKPFLTQLGEFLSDVFFHFDFGKSYISKTSVSAALRQRLPRTIMLGLIGIVPAMVIGILLGITAAVNLNKWQDKLCMLFALIGISMPTFWVALLLVLVFAVKLRWLPPSGIGSVRHYILPALSITIHGIATFARQMRSSMLEVIRSDYITTARSKGLSKREVIFKHALPNALIPIITVIGVHFGIIVGGSIVTETIFSIPGMGIYLMGGISNRDYPIVQACVIVVSFVFCSIMLLVDIAYAFIDPRIKARYTGSSKRRKGGKA